MTLTEFLLARIAEREAGIKYAFGCGMAFPVLSPAEMLAECEAKRRIINGLDYNHPDWYFADAGEVYPVLRFLALPYANHPDYDEVWKP